MPITGFKLDSLTVSPPLLLAPMAGYSDAAFRTGVRALGGLGLAFTEMLNPRSVLDGGGRKRTALLTRGRDDSPLGWQIYGSDPGLMAECARYLYEYREAELIDINMGCPQRKIAGRGEGAALLKDPALARKVAAAVVAAVPIPVTVKIRIGWDAARPVAAALAADLAAAGVAAITLHGRTGTQKYTGKADWRAIAAAAEAAAPTPLIGNGDVTTPEAARELLETTGCAGVMIGRAALRNPWIFRQTLELLSRGRVPAPVSRRTRLEFLIEHLDRTGTLYGREAAPRLFRKWIPQHAAELGIAKPVMVGLLQIRGLENLREGLTRAAGV